MNKPEIKTVRMNLAAAATIATGSIKIPAAAQVFVGAVALPAPNKLMRLSIEENGNTIHDPLHIGWFDGKLGTFQQRGRLLSYAGGTTLDLKVQVSEALNTATEIEVAFEIYKQPVVAVNGDNIYVPGASCE